MSDFVIPFSSGLAVWQFGGLLAVGSVLPWLPCDSKGTCHIISVATCVAFLPGPRSSEGPLINEIPAPNYPLLAPLECS